MSNNHSQSATISGSGILNIGGIVSLTYLIIIVLHVTKNHGGLQKIASLDLNMLGDFLAGIFSPLAFLWIVIAVFVQKEQLRGQLLEFQESNQRQNDQLLLLVKAADIKNFLSIIQVICADSIKAFEYLGFELEGAKESQALDRHSEAISKLVTYLIRSTNVTSDEFQVTDEMMQNRPVILHYLNSIIKQIEDVAIWSKGNNNAEVSAEVSESRLYELKVLFSALVQHIDD